MKVRLVLVVFALVGSITLTYPSATPSSDVREVEVRMGPLASGSSVTGNHTEGSASTGGSLISVRTDMLYLNNTNASGAWYARIDAVGSTGIANLVYLAIGIDNGTASVAQVTSALGVLTQTTGTYVRLEPASANVIYLTQAVSFVGPDSSFTLDVVASDGTNDPAYVITNANLTVT